MLTWKNKFVAAFMAFVILLSAPVAPAFAHGNGHEKHLGKYTEKHKSKHHEQQRQPQPTPVPESKRVETLSPIQTDQVQEIGGFRIGKTAVVWALKYGGKHLSKIMDHVSPRHADLFEEWAFTIGVELEGLTAAYEANLIKFMVKELGFSNAAARNIAWAISMLI